MPGKDVRAGQLPEQMLLSRATQDQSDEDVQHVDILEQARCEVRLARRIALGSLLLAGAACAACAALALPSLFGRQGLTRFAANQETVLDETVYPLFPGMPKLEPGWAKCITNAVVREGHSPESRKVAVVREDTKVFIEEVRGRRVRITHPLDGWLSSMSNDGIEIMRSLNADTLKKQFKRASAQPPAENQSVEEGVERLQKELLKLKGKEGYLMEALDVAARKISDKSKVHEYADAASDSASQVIANVEQALGKLDLGSLDPKKIAGDLLQGRVDLGDLGLDLGKGPALPEEPGSELDIVE